MLPLSEKFFRKHNQGEARLDTPLPELEQPQKGPLALCSRAQLALDCLGSERRKVGSPMRSPNRGPVWQPRADHSGHVFVARPRSSQQFLASASGACFPLTGTTNLCATRHARPSAHTYLLGTTSLISSRDLSFCWRARGHPVAALYKSWPISRLAQRLAWRPNRLPPSRSPLSAFSARI